MPDHRGREPERSETFPRARTVFERTRFFDDDLSKFRRRNASLEGTIVADIVRFQVECRRSKPGERLPDAFEFKVLATARGEYHVSQIYVGRGDYRVAIMFVRRGDKAYLIALFKKTKQINQKEVDLAISRAAHVWESLHPKRGGNV